MEISWKFFQLSGRVLWTEIHLSSMAEHALTDDKHKVFLYLVDIKFTSTSEISTAF